MLIVIKKVDNSPFMSGGSMVAFIGVSIGMVFETSGIYLTIGSVKEFFKK